MICLQVVSDGVKCMMQPLVSEPECEVSDLFEGVLSGSEFSNLFAFSMPP